MERIRLMRSCEQEIADVAHKQMQKLATDRFVVLCVDILPRWGTLAEKYIGGRWHNILKKTDSPLMVAAMCGKQHCQSLYALLAGEFPGQAGELKQPTPADKAKVIVLDTHGMTVCFIDPLPATLTRH